MKIKNIYHVYVELFEYEFFFDEKGRLLTYWLRNDAEYRQEYMGPLFKALGINIVSGDLEDKRWFEQIKEILRRDGGTEEEISSLRFLRL